MKNNFNKVSNNYPDDLVETTLILKKQLLERISSRIISKIEQKLFRYIFYRSSCFGQFRVNQLNQLRKPCISCIPENELADQSARNGASQDFIRPDRAIPISKQGGNSASTIWELFVVRSSVMA